MRLLEGTLVLPVVLTLGVPADAATAPDGLRHFMANPVVVTRKVQRDEPLPECFGTLASKSWETVAKAEPYEAELRKTVCVALSRNEFESAQIVIKSTEGNLRNCRVRLGPVRHEATGTLFSANGMTLFRVEFVHTYNLWNAAQSLGWWPDPLIPLKPGEAMTVPAGRNQPILLRFHAATDTPAGEYRGRLTITADGFQSESLPVRLLVFDFALPGEQHFTASIPVWGGQPEKMYPGSMTADNKRACLDLLLAHRISPFPLTPEETEYALGRGMRWFCVLTLPKDHVPADLKSRATAIRRRWQTRGWFERATAYVLLGDEPSVAQWPHIVQQGRILHECAPRLVRMNTVSLDALFAGPDRPKDPPDAYRRSFDTLGEVVDYFLLATGSYPVGEGTELAYVCNQKVWWYTVADIVYIPTAGAHVRVHFWKQWKYHVPGWLHWGLTYWGDANIRGKDGKKWPAVPWDTRAGRSGDGYLVYPAPGGDGLWPSLRLEIIRDGIEDYEYFVLLNELTARLATTGRDRYAARIATNRKLLAIDGGIVHSYREATTDGAMLLAARTRLGRAIEATRKLVAGRTNR